MSDDLELTVEDLAMAISLYPEAIRTLGKRLAKLEKVAEAAREYKMLDDRRWETGRHVPELRAAWLKLDAALKSLDEATP